jgi:sirohydrochlorin ferrochelatase
MTADLVACAHGTADPRGRRVVHDLVRAIAGLRSSVAVSLGFVDVDLPSFSSVVARVVADSNGAVVVPLLLSSGYHVQVDIRRDCGSAVVAAALGPHPLLIEVLADRLGDPVSSVDRVVLAAAGSSDVRALRDCERTAVLLADRIGLPVEVGYLSGRGRRLREALEGPGRVAVASYLLAPGFFADRAARISAAAGAVMCSTPLGDDPRIARLALIRYDEALARLRSEAFELPPRRHSLVTKAVACG